MESNKEINRDKFVSTEENVTLKKLRFRLRSLIGHSCVYMRARARVCVCVCVCSKEKVMFDEIAKGWK